MDRDDVFIANVLKSRPPGNRDPAAGRDRGLPAVPGAPGGADRAARDLHAGQLRHQAADGLAAGDHAGARRAAGARAGRAHGAALPDLPPGGGAAHAERSRSSCARTSPSCRRCWPSRCRRSPRRRPAEDASRPPGRGRPAGPVRQIRTRAPGTPHDSRAVPVTRETASAEETEALGAELAARLAPGDVVLVSGDLGAGKTTFVRGAARALGVEGPVTSPTFTIGHVLAGRVEVAHLDLYRLASLEGEDPQLLDDYLTPERIGFVEWPAVGEAAVPARGRAGAARARRRRPADGGDRVNVLGLDTSTAGQRRRGAARRRRGVRARPRAGGAERPARPLGRADAARGRRAGRRRPGLGRPGRGGRGGRPGRVHRPAHRRGHRPGAGRGARSGAAPGVVAGGAGGRHRRAAARCR